MSAAVLGPETLARLHELELSRGEAGYQSADSYCGLCGRATSGDTVCPPCLHGRPGTPFAVDFDVPPRSPGVPSVELREPFEAEGMPSAGHSWQPIDLVAASQTPPEPPTIGGLLYRGKRILLSGETESLKTWLALILTKAEIDAGYTVAWADLDAMGRGAILARLRALGVADGLIARRFLYYDHRVSRIARGRLCEVHRCLGARSSSTSVREERSSD
jgi:hypothetical protein